MPLTVAFGLVFAVALILWTEGVRRLRAAEAALLATTETPCSILAAWIVVSEAPPLLTVVGGLLIVGAVVTHARADLARDRVSRPWQQPTEPARGSSFWSYANRSACPARWTRHAGGPAGASREAWRRVLSEEAPVRKVTETDLPGVGIRFDLQTDAGRCVGVVAHQTGRRDLVIYDERDIDRACESVELTEDEGHTLGELLGGSPVLEHLDDAVHRLEDIVISWITIDSRLGPRRSDPGGGRAADEHRRRGRRPRQRVGLDPHPGRRQAPRTGRHGGGGRRPLGGEGRHQVAQRARRPDRPSPWVRATTS